MEVAAEGLEQLEFENAIVKSGEGWGRGSAHSSAVFLQPISIAEFKAVAGHGKMKRIENGSGKVGRADCRVKTVKEGSDFFESIFNLNTRIHGNDVTSK